MAFNGSGVFNRLYNWVNDAAANIKIRADRMDAEFNGIATGLSNCVTKDGQTTVTANLPMSGFNHTGVAVASARTEYSRFDQVQDGKSNWSDAGGTSDAITATYNPAITALVDGQECFVRASAANSTTTPTFSPNSLTARTIVKAGGQALVAGDINGDGHELHLRYDLSNTRWELLNPYFDTSANNTFSGDNTYTGDNDFSGGSMTLDSATIALFATAAQGAKADTALQPADKTAANGMAMVLLDTKTASNSPSLDFTSYIDGTYDEYEFHFIDITPQTDSTHFYVRTSSDGGTSFDSGASDYKYAETRSQSGTTVSGERADNAHTAISMGNDANWSNAAGEGIYGIATLYKPSGTTNKKVIRFHVAGYDALGEVMDAKGVGGRVSTSAINAVRFLMSSGNIVSGTIYMFGIRKV